MPPVNNGNKPVNASLVRTYAYKYAFVAICCIAILPCEKQDFDCCTFAPDDADPCPDLIWRCFSTPIGVKHRVSGKCLPVESEQNHLG